jgi:adenylate cyclase class 2
VETEIKLPLSDIDTALEKIRAAGFTEAIPRVFEVNVIYDTNSEDLQKKRELLRLRHAGAKNTLTWKGVSVPGRHKSRPETEVTFGDFDAMEQILQRLGYKPVFRYEKYRTEFRENSGGGVLTLDETPIGCFVELEGEPEWIDTVAERLGFAETLYITASYGSLYRQHRARNVDAPEWMVFR